VVLHDPSVGEDKLPRLAVRPYPIKYIGQWTLKNGKNVTIRPIRPEDEPLLVKFHETLSDRTVYARYFQPLSLNQRIAHERLTRICFIDYAREMALVADYTDANGEHHILGVGRLNKIHGTSEGRFSIIVTDNYQHQGLGTELLRRLLDVARQEKLTRMSADILPTCEDMRRMCANVGCQELSGANDSVLQVQCDL
jgi:acetyltransferase